MRARSRALTTWAVSEHQHQGDKCHANDAQGGNYCFTAAITKDSIARPWDSLSKYYKKYDKFSLKSAAELVCSVVCCQMVANETDGEILRNSDLRGHI